MKIGEFFYGTQRENIYVICPFIWASRADNTMGRILALFNRNPFSMLKVKI